MCCFGRIFLKYTGHKLIHFLYILTFYLSLQCSVPVPPSAVWVGLQCVIVVFPDNIHLLFLLSYIVVQKLFCNPTNRRTCTS